MAEYNSNIRRLKDDIKKLRSLLVILTLIQIGQILLILSGTSIFTNIDFVYMAKWPILGLHLLTAVIFIWYIWQKMPIKKRKKVYNTIMILFLGIIGMWMWMHGNRELKEMSEY